jgi:hypothetical protein
MLAHDSCHVVWGISIKISKTVKYGSCCYFKDAALLQAVSWVKGVEVIILYPSGKVSDIQERQLTTLGQNIKALEVDGVFDDCQDMVKKSF